MRNAKQHGLVLPLYIHEPSQIADAHTARQHQLFVHECLDDLHQQLRDVGGYLHEELGEAVDVLARLHAQFK
ncbi:deoxyribodipyrimidine photo-lyase, partial [Vibrio vulnificus]|uniref:deoxyribodipyrimidine photo-lyase n=2 Tax=Pseudomonadota TaxID=1224 RepID=UPI0039B4DD65